jgi:uncharacterized protein YbjT (DUF2867 family)
MSRVLVIGAYGMIGAALVRHLQSQGHTVSGLGRDLRQARRAFPGLAWHIHDLAHMTLPADWLHCLSQVDFAVNAAGALQTGPGDNLTSVHADAIAALAEACAMAGVGLVQISAVGVAPDAPTHFLRSKAVGDAAIGNAGGAYWILRPGLVLADTAYGGTALLRMLCAVPLVQPIAAPDAPVQTVGMADLARAVQACIDGTIAPRATADLVEPAPHRLDEIVAAMRGWLGFAPARATFAAPGWLLTLTARGADVLGRLGWRSPLRSTAVQTLSGGVLGDPGPWRALGGADMAPLGQTLAAMPARSEDRLAARVRLLMPLTIAALALFWALSGLIGLVRLPQAAAILTDRGWPLVLAELSVVLWSLADLGLAAALMWRPWAKRACLGMIAVGLAYLGLATAVAPGLWLDPLGPLVKIIPATMLAAAALPMLESR